MVNENKDLKLNLRLDDDSRVLHTRIREQSSVGATLFIRLRMFKIQKECHLRGTKGFLRPVIYDDVYSLIMADGKMWIHFKLRFKHANTNDEPEVMDSEVEIQTESYPESIACLVKVSTPRYVVVRTDMFSFIHSAAKGRLDIRDGTGTRSVVIEDTFIQKDTEGIPEYVIRVRFTDEPQTTGIKLPEQAKDHARRDISAIDSDPQRPSILMSNAAGTDGKFGDRERQTVITRRTLHEQRRSVWRPINDWALRHGKATVYGLSTVLVILLCYIVVDHLGFMRRAKPTTTDATIQPTAPVVMTASTDAVTPVVTGMLGATIQVSPENLRLFFYQRDPACMVGLVRDSTGERGLGFECSAKPTYDASRKCTDVRDCRIRLPGNGLASAGPHPFTDEVATAYFHQKDAGCLIEPSLPFNADPKDLREGMRMDADCTDFTFDPVRGCFDYRQCSLIIPQYEGH